MSYAKTDMHLGERTFLLLVGIGDARRLRTRNTWSSCVCKLPKRRMLMQLLPMLHRLIRTQQQFQAILMEAKQDRSSILRPTRTLV